MKTLNDLTFHGQPIQYKVFSDYDEYNGSYHWTEFYIGTTTRTYRKWVFWGETITVTEPRMVFKRYFNIESNEYTREEVRAYVTRQLALLDRKEQIEKGIIV